MADVKIAGFRRRAKVYKYSRGEWEDPRINMPLRNGDIVFAAADSEVTPEDIK